MVVTPATFNGRTHWNRPRLCLHGLMGSLWMMRSPLLHRCFAIALLLCNLVFGQFVHAAAMMGFKAPVGSIQTAAAPAMPKAHCEHHRPALSESSSAQHQHLGSAVGKPDCCKHGNCDCPGLHAPAMASSTVILDLPYLSEPPARLVFTSHPLAHSAPSLRPPI